MGRRARVWSSKVGRRVTLLFVMSALLPISAIAVIAFTHVASLFTNQAYAQLRHTAKSYGVLLYDRLELLDEQFAAVASAPLQASAGPLPVPDNLRRQVDRLSVLTGRAVEDFLDDNGSKLAHLKQGKALLTAEQAADRSVAIHLARRLPSSGGKEALLVADIKPGYLWGDRNLLPFMTDICVLDAQGIALYCSAPLPMAGIREIKRSRELSESGRFDWQDGDREFLASYRELFLKPGYYLSNVSVVAFQDKEQALSGIAGFERIFPPVIILAVLIVALLSTTQIRRSLVPLARLREGTRRLANQQFDSQVSIDSGDEFEELAAAFNQMAERLGRQFAFMNTLSELDRTILSSHDLDQVLEMTLNLASSVVRCDCISLMHIEGEAAGLVHTRLPHVEDDGARIQRLSLDSDELLILKAGVHIYLSADEHQELGYLKHLRELGAEAFHLLPITVKDRLWGVIIFGYRQEPKLSEDELRQAQDFADRVAVAASTALHEEQLLYQANHDVLTGLPNRNLLQDRLTQEIAHSHREGHKLALLFIDLDRFKTINDTQGHSIGDLVLKEAASRIQRCIRDVDTVARLGGDEFTVVLPRMAQPQDAGSVAEAIIRTLSEPFYIENREHYLSASIGITLYPTDGTTEEELLMNADTAMYRAKNSGRGRYLFFEEEMNTQARELHDLERYLRHALERGEFHLSYQPLIELSTGRVISAEALLRWQHPDYGVILPDRFIPLAEETGLIDDIGLWVLREACAQFQRWHADGREIQRIAVNISSRQFRCRDFRDMVRSALDDAGMAARHLELEITESLFMEDAGHTLDLLKQLRGLGVRISIDDFGTGYSSLTYLNRFHIDTLKIDKSFLDGVPAVDTSSALVRSIINMAKNLRKEVVAEGVETEGQANFAREQGCDYGQGYFFSKPLNTDQLTRLLAERGSHAESNALDDSRPDSY